MISKFKYLAKDPSGKTIKGSVEAESEIDAIVMLRRRKITVITLNEIKTRGQKVGRAKIKVEEISIFCRQLSTMVDSGIPLVTCLEVLSEQTENRIFRDILEKIRLDVKEGSGLSDALGRH
ncbi:MAG: type II secretion system F family protein, partial [Candidatus Omnitrophica bacterium]|nr:type II secretion system F family protein [Candidatus Omnitrophota bacterium]